MPRLGGRWETQTRFSEVGGRLSFRRDRARPVARRAERPPGVSTRAAGIAGGIGENQRPPRSPLITLRRAA